jgi:hypothetical protein
MFGDESERCEGDRTWSLGCFPRRAGEQRGPGAAAARVLHRRLASGPARAAGSCSSCTRLPRRSASLPPTTPMPTCVLEPAGARACRGVPLGRSASLTPRLAVACACLELGNVAAPCPPPPVLQALVRWGGALLELAHHRQQDEAVQLITEVGGPRSASRRPTPACGPGGRPRQRLACPPVTAVARALWCRQTSPSPRTAGGISPGWPGCAAPGPWGFVADTAPPPNSTAVDRQAQPGFGTQP